LMFILIHVHITNACAQ